MNTMDVESLRYKFPAAANYLSQIFLIERDYAKVNNLKLSERLHVSKPAVTQSIRRLSKLGLVSQDRYGVINLTDDGRKIAREIMIRHYLIEHVLVDLLDYPWEKSDREAKELQVIISDDLKEHLMSRLGNPRTCPHGNPFPGSPEEEKLISAPRLINAIAGRKLTLLRITEEGEELDGLLEFCFKNNLKPGIPIILHGRDNDGLIISKKNESKTFRVPLRFARHLCYDEYS